ncbi:MAG: hypothetical protein ACREAY_01790 [Nitrososphaera sp.]
MKVIHTIGVGGAGGNDRIDDNGGRNKIDGGSGTDRCGAGAINYES